MATTQLAPHALPGPRYGDFSGKEIAPEPEPPTPDVSVFSPGGSGQFLLSIRRKLGSNRYPVSSR